MGTCCSKVCKEKTKRYEEKDQKNKKRNCEGVKHHAKRNSHRQPRQPVKDGSGKRKGLEMPSQPIEDESTVNYAITNGGKPDNNKGNDENMKENNYIRPNINGNENVDINRENKDNSKGRRKRRRKKLKRRSYSSDSSCSTSSSSTSSSSDADNGKTTRSKQKKTNNDGSVAYITNKTTIGSSKISFKAAKNINIYKNNYLPQPKSDVPKSEKTHKKTHKLFEQGYTGITAEIEEKKLLSSFRNQNPAKGQFVDLRGQDNVQSVFNTGILYDCSEWVGQIVFQGGNRTCVSTCFRVGSKYIMTTLHSIMNIIDNCQEYIPVQGNVARDQFSQLHCLSEHNIFVDFAFLVKDQSRAERNKFHFKHVQRGEDIPFYDEDIDTIVLELQDNPSKTLPLQFTNFGIPKMDMPLHLITHSKGNPKEIDKVTKIVDIDSQQTVDDIKFLKAESKRFMEDKGVNPERYPCETCPHNILRNHNRMLFHCASNKGASGSPGVQVTSSGQVVVVTMLLHGYPDWYYDDACKEIKADWPQENTIEQGVNFASVYSKMKDQNIDLCNEVFPAANQLTDSTVHTVHAVQPTDGN